MDKLRKNYLFNLCYQIFSMLAPLITIPYVSRILGADGIGLYNLSYTTATIFVAIAQLGTISFAIREVAFRQNDIKERSLIFWDVVILRLMTSIISTLVYLFIFARGVNKDVYIIQGLCILGVAVDISWFFQGIEDFKSIAIRDFLSKIVSIICVFIFVKNKDEVGLYSLILVSAIIAGRIANWPILVKKLVRVKVSLINPFHDLKTIFILFIPQISNQLFIAVDKCMLGMFTATTFENGYYAQADRIVKLCVAALTAVVTVMMPRIADAFASKDEKVLYRYLCKTYRFVGCIEFPMAFGMAAIINNAIPWFFGPGYDKVAILIYIFVPQVILLGINSVSGMYLVATKRQNKYAFSIAVGTVFNIALNIILIRRWLSIGAAIASVLAESIVLFIQLNAIKSKNVIFDEIRYSLIKYFITALLMGICIVCFSKFVSPRFIDTFLLISLGAMVYFILLIILKDDLVIKEISKIAQKIKKW